jgi:hypothetical protein
VEADRGGGAKEAQQWTEGSETGTEKISRNCKKKLKKHRNRQKSNLAKHQNKNRDRGGRDEEKGRRAPGLGTSSKLIEPGAKGWRLG